MKLTTVAVFGIGYVLGSRAGRERYEQLRELARGASDNFDASSVRQRLNTLAAQLDGYSSATSSRRTPPA
jgi:hypothetical protein